MLSQQEHTQGARLILFHKQATSARLRFLRLAHGGVCAPKPLPASTQVMESDVPCSPVAPHPAQFISRAEDWLGLPGGSLVLEGGFRATVDTATRRYPDDPTWLIAGKI